MMGVSIMKLGRPSVTEKVLHLLVPELRLSQGRLEYFSMIKHNHIVRLPSSSSIGVKNRLFGGPLS
jgi:hypothetical protein